MKNKKKTFTVKIKKNVCQTIINWNWKRIFYAKSLFLKFIWFLEYSNEWFECWFGFWIAFVGPFCDF